jgi:DNA-binding CsgD family transcriptional regulator/PAS domain-containing protein
MTGAHRRSSSQEGRAGDDRFAAAVEAIYDAAPDPSLWPHALQKIADCFGDLGAILIWRRDDGGFGTIVSPRLIDAQRDYQENEWYLRDLVLKRVIERPLWTHKDTFSDRDVVSAAEMATDPFFTDFGVRHGIRWHMGVAVAPDPHIAVWIAMQRGPEKPAHSEAEKSMTMRLGRHVEKSLRLSIRLLDAELANLGLGGALTRLGVGVFALDSLARVKFRNPAAERLLGNGVAIVDDRLHLGAGEARAEADLAIARALRGAADDLPADLRPILVLRTAPERPLVAYLLPIAPRDDVADPFLTHVRSIVLVIEPKPNEPADPALVRDLLGLTLGEARVAALVAAGAPPRQAAQSLGITEETARTVLKRIYGKVGVSRQSELTALLGRLAIGGGHG